MTEVVGTDEGAPLQAWVVGIPGSTREELGRRLVRAGFAVRYSQQLGSVPQKGGAAGDEPGEQRARGPSRDWARDPSVVVVQHVPPRLDGLAVVRRLSAGTDVPVILVSAEASIAVCEAAIRGGARRFFAEGDSAEIGRVSRDLVRQEEGPSKPGAQPIWTAADARFLRDRELFEELHRLLYETRGNIAEMARRLGKDRSTVRYHLQRFQLLGRIRMSPSAAPAGEDSDRS